MPANPQRYFNIAQLDASTGDFIWNKLVHPFPNPGTSGYGACYRMVPITDGSGRVLVSCNPGGYQPILCCVDANGCNRWYLENIRQPSSDLVSFGYDSVNHIVIAITGRTVAGHYELRGMDPDDGSTIWSRSWPAYPATNGLDSVCVYGAKCIATLIPMATGEVHCVDTTTGADMWTTTPGGLMRVDAIDSNGDWIRNVGGGTSKMSGTTGSVITTPAWTAYNVDFGPGGYSGVGSGAAECWRTGGTGVTKLWNITSIAGGTISGPYTSCSETGPNYLFGASRFSISGGAYINVFKVDSSGGFLWGQMFGATAFDNVQCCASPGDGTFWIGGPTTEA